MRKVLRVLPVIFLLAVALVINVSASSAAKFEIENPAISLNPAQVGDNVTSTGEGDNVTAVTGGTSFWSIFPPWVWWTIGAIIAVLLIMIIVLVAMPSRKKQGAAAIKGVQGCDAGYARPTGSDANPNSDVRLLVPSINPSELQCHPKLREGSLCRNSFKRREHFQHQVQWQPHTHNMLEDLYFQ